MRRIIERVVTVVTTTTWKISWEADPVTGALSSPGAVPKTTESIQSHPTISEMKEADLHETKIENDTLAESPPQNH